MTSRREVGGVLGFVPVGYGDDLHSMEELGAAKVAIFVAHFLVAEDLSQALFHRGSKGRALAFYHHYRQAVDEQDQIGNIFFVIEDSELTDDVELVVLRVLVVYEQHILALFAQAVAQVLQDGGASLQHAMELLVGLDDRGGLNAGNGPDDSLGIIIADPGVEALDGIEQRLDEMNVFEGLSHLLGLFGVDLLPAQMLSENLDSRIFDLQELLGVRHCHPPLP